VHFGSVFGSGSNIKWNFKQAKKVNNKRSDDKLLGNNAASNIKKARFFCTIFLTDKYGLDPVTDFDPEPEPKLLQSLTGTGIKR
jgi:hypothetical protein